MKETNKKQEQCEYDSFFDCYTNKEHCKKHFRITGASMPKLEEEDN